MEDREILLQAKGLVKDFHVPGGVVSSVAGVDLDIYRGETLGLVGESGCGKSTLGRLLMHLIEPTAGKVIFDGIDLDSISPAEMRALRQRMQIIFQDPFSSLDPRMTVGQIIEEPLKIHKLCPDKKAREEQVRALMKRIGIRPEYYNRYPHQFSGGQRQRIGIARAIALSPQLVVCDEPVSALDVSVQSQVLNLLKDLQAARGLTYLFISHDLSVVNFIADRVCVMFLGKICEIAPKEDLYDKPLHPYTRFLLDAIPQADPHLRGKEKMVLQGEIPSPVNPPSGCRFHTRCPYATELCSTQEPELRTVGDRQVACHHAGAF